MAGSISDSETTQPVVIANAQLDHLVVTVTAGPDAGRTVVVSEPSLVVGSGNDVTLRLSDPTVSRSHIDLQRLGGLVRVIDHGSTNGTVIGSVTLKGNSADLALPAQIALGRSIISVRASEIEVSGAHRACLPGVVGSSPAMRLLADRAHSVAPTDVSVLIQGESGTGKELLAHAIHELSRRAPGPFVIVDCGAIPLNLAVSHFFGHERGAFTGADRLHRGAFERAHGGTLFLDEIGELPLATQAALLGALERRRITRVGGSQEIPIDVRVVCATHRDLRAAVHANEFRRDLYYRLAVVRLEIPALRERIQDLPELASALLFEAHPDSDGRPVLDQLTLQRMAGHRWPGNVRELRNYIQGALALGEFPAIEASEWRGDLISSVLDRDYREAKRLVVEEFERRYVSRRLDLSQGNVKQAATDAGMDRSFLSELIKRHQLKQK